MLIIGILITANLADARPAGTIIKEGVLTYPAGPYLKEAPLLNLESYGNDGTILTSGDYFREVDPENECLCIYNNSESIISWTPEAGNLLISPSNLQSIYYDCNLEILQPGFAFLCNSTSPSFNLSLFQPDGFIHSI
ncbi:hypothetical protein [Methanosarcina lacustris]|uniref:hypothetical protein n=1 Tax=Methanosarcina lacustris TaxID=170861 RepID=UPI00064E2F23|nr:hypothetical protein [Methanosarcina lacustris]